MEKFHVGHPLAPLPGKCKLYLVGTVAPNSISSTLKRDDGQSDWGTTLSSLFLLCTTVADPASTPLTWQFNGTELTLIETAAWTGVVSFEIPDSGGEVAEIYYGRGVVAKVRVGAELYRIEYDSDDEISDIVLENAGSRRGLQSETRKEYQLPAWMSPSTVEGAMTSRISCNTCNLVVEGVCLAQELMCGKKALKKFLATGSVIALLSGVSTTIITRVIPVLGFMCQAVGYACNAHEVLGATGLFDSCDSLFCCDRSRCGLLGECYDESTKKCCERRLYHRRRELLRGGGYVAYLVHLDTTHGGRRELGGRRSVDLRFRSQ